MDLRLDVRQSNAVIDELGGVTKIAKLFNISTAATAQWRKTGIPSARAMYLKEAFKSLKAWELEPRT